MTSNFILNSHLYTYDYFRQDDVCRLCWNGSAIQEITKIQISNEKEHSLVDIIKECLEIDVSETQYPNKVCDSCCAEIKQFFTFKIICRENNNKLIQIINNHNKHIVDSSTVIKSESQENDLNLENSNIYLENYSKFENIDNFEESTLILEEITCNSPLAQCKEKKASKVKHKKVYKSKRSPNYCNICRLDLKSKEGFSFHNSECHGVEQDGKLFKCFGCEKRFNSRKNRLGHELNFCKGLKDGYKCSICHRYLPKRSTYEMHMKDHRLNTKRDIPENIFKCRKCCLLFKSRQSLRNHMIEHEKINFVCDMCGRVFTRQDYLHKHSLIHTGTRSHQCPHCDFKATQKTTLTVHIRKHTGERPYSCDLCPQRCVSSSNLRAHRQRHFGAKTFECTICQKKFGYKISLEEHVSATHERSEVHSCAECGATYTRKRGLRRHLVAKHGPQAGPLENEPNVLNDKLQKFELKEPTVMIKSDHLFIV